MIGGALINILSSMILMKHNFNIPLLNHTVYDFTSEKKVQVFLSLNAKRYVSDNNLESIEIRDYRLHFRREEFPGKYSHSIYILRAQHDYNANVYVPRLCCFPEKYSKSRFSKYEPIAPKCPSCRR